jgi:hypothetical protein
MHRLSVDPPRDAEDEAGELTVRIESTHQDAPHLLSDEQHGWGHELPKIVTPGCALQGDALIKLVACVKRAQHVTGGRD